MSDDDVKLREALKAAQQIVDAIAAIKGKKLAIAFRDDATAQHVGMIIENAAKVSRALLNRPNSSSPDGRAWQTIDTAPKDGTKVLTYGRAKGVSVTRWHQPANPNARGFWTSDSHSMTPTHWMPLPSPPSDDQRSALPDDNAFRYGAEEGMPQIADGATGDIQMLTATEIEAKRRAGRSKEAAGVEVEGRLRSEPKASEPAHNPDSPKPPSDKDAVDIQPKDRADG